MIAVTFALPVESSEFVRRLENKSRGDRNGVTIVRGTIGDRSIEVIHTGVGEKICSERMDNFLKDQRIDVLISSGFAGSLTDALQMNDILIASNFSTIDAKRVLAAIPNVSIKMVKMLTMPALIDSCEERRDMASKSGASAVDMETASIAHVCAAHGIPLLSFRVITDTPTRPLPAPPTVLFDIQRQRTNIAGFAKFFLNHPNRLPGLIQFARSVAQAKKKLATALETIVRHL